MTLSMITINDHNVHLSDTSYVLGTTIYRGWIDKYIHTYVRTYVHTVR